jgi:hypothetical protein
MSRDNGAKRMRERIAYLAARLMAEEGIDDFGFAKRKAARRAGAPETRNLPNNEEIEQALQTFRALYQRHEHPLLLRALRRKAVTAMRLLEPFAPHLTGSVLSGCAGKYSDINLQLFADSAKDVEIYLLNQEIPYRVAEQRVLVGEDWQAVPRLSFELDGTEVNASVFRSQDQRQVLKTAAGGKPLERVKIDWLEAAISGEPEQRG